MVSKIGIGHCHEPAMYQKPIDSDTTHLRSSLAACLVICVFRYLQLYVIFFQFE